MRNFPSIRPHYLILSPYNPAHIHLLQRVKPDPPLPPVTAPAIATMNQIARLLPPSNVVLDLAVTSKKRLFEQAGLLFENNQGVERGKVFDSLFARERLGSTGLGEGVAIPHGRIKGLKHTHAALVKLATPIPFDAPDGEPVRLLIFLLVPEHASEEHLELLSELAEMLSDGTIRESLLECKDCPSVLGILANWEPTKPQ
jgi:nitrogen PTS system EIIA component